MGFRGLAGSERVKGEKKLKSERQKEENSRERDWPPISIPIVGCGPCCLNSYANRQLKVRRDNTKPTWLSDTNLNEATAFRSLVVIHWGPERSQPSTLRWTDILSLLWSIWTESRFCSLWVTITIGRLSINYHWNACVTEEGLFGGWGYRLGPWSYAVVEI